MDNRVNVLPGGEVTERDVRDKEQTHGSTRLNNHQYRFRTISLLKTFEVVSKLL